MQRQIFIVDAHIVDANGTFNFLDGYPKRFDSSVYGNDIDKAQYRAIGDASEAYGAMCKRDDRQMQVVTVETADGFQIFKQQRGALAEVPDVQPTPEE